MCSDLEVGKDFFHLFGMFEYALKANGYCTPDCPNEYVRSANWDKFFSENRSLLESLDTQNFTTQEAITYILGSPPKQQFLNENKELVWEDHIYAETMRDFQKIYLYIKRVRNNLFHGGKYRGCYFEAPERSRDLITYSTIILGHVIENHSGLKNAFEGASNRMPAPPSTKLST